MSEILSYLGRQRERLGRRIRSLFGAKERQADFSSWKYKLENRNQSDGCGIELGNILPSDQAAASLSLQDIEDMLNDVSQDDEEITSAKELLRKELTSLHDMGDPNLQDLLKTYSQDGMSDQNANRNTEDANDREDTNKNEDSGQCEAQNKEVREKMCSFGVQTHREVGNKVKRNLQVARNGVCSSELGTRSNSEYEDRKLSRDAMNELYSSDLRNFTEDGGKDQRQPQQVLGKVEYALKDINNCAKGQETVEGAGGGGCYLQQRWQTPQVESVSTAAENRSTAQTASTTVKDRHTADAASTAAENRNTSAASMAAENSSAVDSTACLAAKSASTTLNSKDTGYAGPTAAENKDSAGKVSDLLGKASVTPVENRDTKCALESKAATTDSPTQKSKNSGKRSRSSPKFDAVQNEPQQNRKRRKRSSSNRYTSPQLTFKRLSLSLEELNHLSDRHGGGSDIDLLSDAELASTKITPRSEDLSYSANAQTVTTVDFEAERGSFQTDIEATKATELDPDSASDDTQKTDLQQLRGSHWKIKLKQLFSPRKYQEPANIDGTSFKDRTKNYDDVPLEDIATSEADIPSKGQAKCFTDSSSEKKTTCYAATRSEDKTKHHTNNASEDSAEFTFVPAHRTAAKVSLVGDEAKMSITQALADNDAELTKSWWEFLDAVSTASSDICTWEDFVHVTDRQQMFDDQKNLVPATGRTDHHLLDQQKSLGPASALKGPTLGQGLFAQEKIESEPQNKPTLCLRPFAEEIPGSTSHKKPTFHRSPFAEDMPDPDSLRKHTLDPGLPVHRRYERQQPESQNRLRLDRLPLAYCSHEGQRDCQNESTLDRGVFVQKIQGRQQLDSQPTGRKMLTFSNRTVTSDHSFDLNANERALGSKDYAKDRPKECTSRRLTEKGKSQNVSSDRGDSVEASHLLCNNEKFRSRGFALNSNDYADGTRSKSARRWHSLSDIGRSSSVVAQACDERSENINVSMSTKPEGTRRFNRMVRFWSVPKAESARQLSAPELRQKMGLEEEAKWLSQHDIPFCSHVGDASDGYAVDMDPKDAEVQTPPLLWGEAAYKHYKLLMAIETKQKVKKITEAKNIILQKYMAKQEALEHIVKVAKAYYSNPTGKHREDWKKLRKEIDQSSEHSITDIRHKLTQIPEYLPYFTCFIIMAQVLSLTAIFAFGGLAPVGILSEKELKREIQTFLGAETFHRWVTPNPWIGPPITVLLASGASLATCMRHDRYVREYSRQKQYVRINNRTFGCCQMPGPINAAGTTTEWECRQWTSEAGKWGPPLCAQRAPGLNSIAHVIRPCCVDHKGTCKMMSHEHCNFLQGFFHPDKEHCVEVNCIRDACKIGKEMFLIDSDSQKPWLPAGGEKLQWWRLLISLILTFGALHCLPLVTIEWLLLRPLEKSAGWLRVLVIYFVCGIAGQIVAGIAQPYVPHVGSTSAVAGMIGEAAVELSQAWHLLNKPHLEALKLSFFLLFLLLMGLLPYVSLLGTLTGLGCGALCALVVMPYIAFANYSKIRMWEMIGLGTTLLLVFNVTILYIYIQIQPLPCKVCRAMECLSFSENMCNEWELYG